MSLGRQAAQGAVWNYGAFLLSKAFVFVATLILARLLTPAEFGLVGTALLVISILDIVRDFGIGAAVIYHKEGRAAADLAFVLSAIIGTTLFAANWLLAPLSAQFFKSSGPEETALITSVLQVFGLCILLSSLGSTHDALLQKRLNYKQRMVPEVARTLIKGALSVLLAYLGWGVWALVWGQVAGEAAATALLWIVSRWRPTLAFDRSLLRPILGYGFQIMLVNGFGTLLANVDYFIIGRVLGVGPLGLYTLAFRIPELLIRNMALAVSNVAFSVAAQLQTDRRALRDAYLQMQHYMLIVMAPLGFGLCMITPNLVHLLFAPQWEPMIPVMQVLSLYMVLIGISHWPGVIYKAVGRPDILNRLSFVKLVLLVPVLWWSAVNYGIMGVAWGQIAARSLTLLLDMYVASRFIDLSMLGNLRAIAPPVAASGVMALAVQGVLLLEPDQESLAALALAVLVGAAVYAIIEWLLDRKAVLALIGLLLNMVRGRGSSAGSVRTQGVALGEQGLPAAAETRKAP